MKIAVIGAGSWGTALACLLGEKYPEVSLWVRGAQAARQIDETRQNGAYLPGVRLPACVHPTNDLEAALSAAELVVLVTPSHAMREMAARISSYVSERIILVSAAKGLELGSLKRMSEVIAEEIPALQERIAVLSGPNHAEEVGARHPTATVVSALQQSIAEEVQDVFISPYFRVYTNPDLIGVELGGALKNIIALGAGIVEGLQLGDNTKAALMTRGIAEISRLGVALGASPSTFGGLAGIGDLIVTCTSRHSRNHRAGILLAQGKTMEQIQSETNMVVEGIRSTKAAYELADRFNVDMPITRETYRVLYENKSPQEAVMDLMTRSRTHEMEEVAPKNLLWRKN